MWRTRLVSRVVNTLSLLVTDTFVRLVSESLPDKLKSLVNKWRFIHCNLMQKSRIYKSFIYAQVIEKYYCQAEYESAISCWLIVCISIWTNVYGGCLDKACRWRTRYTAKVTGELWRSCDPIVSEWGNLALWGRSSIFIEVRVPAELKYLSTQRKRKRKRFP